MNPKEKSIQLVNMFRPFVDDEIAGEFAFHFSFEEQTKNAKQCAIISVDELINHFLSNEICFRDHSIPIGHYKYWDEVKTELEKM